MYELIQAAEHSYYIDCPAKIGIFAIGDSEVVAIDSGSDKDAGKKAFKILQSKGWTLKAIYNTHSHADHIGGNKYLQDQSGCRIFARGIECDFTNHPILEPSLLFGAFPPAALRHKFYLAQESIAEPMTEKTLPCGLEIVPLPGHCTDMVGFRTCDNVVYLADCLSSEETLEKYGVGYIFDVERYLETLEYVKNLSADKFIPSHAPACDDIAPLAQYNIDKVNSICDKISELCEDGICFDDLLCKLFYSYGMTMNIGQYALVGSTLRSYLTYLQNKGKVDALISDNKLMWKRM